MRPKRSVSFQLRRVDAKDAVLDAVARLDRVAVERGDLGVRAERHRFWHAIALDQNDEDDNEYQRDQLAERLSKLARRLAVGFGLWGLGLAFRALGLAVSVLKNAAGGLPQ